MPKRETPTYQLSDLQKLDPFQLFGLFAMCELDGISHPGPDDYARVYKVYFRRYCKIGFEQLHRRLAREQINKPVKLTKAERGAIIREELNRG